jgi:lipoate-protein ligase A
VLAVSSFREIRVLQDPPLDGARNMARDEALLRLVGALESPPTLRLYQWCPATISLGYFQPFAEYQALRAPAGTLPVVRRLTGGGAILHDLELTYSLTLPAGHPLLLEGPSHPYELAHDAIIRCLGAFDIEAARDGETDDSGPTRGPFFCFARRHKFDVLIDEDKVAGSAQRRTKEAVLQHGSIILGNRYAQQPTAVMAAPFDEAVHRLRGTLVEQLAALTGELFEPGEWLAAELSAAETLIAKYAGDQWTRRT